MKKLLILTLTLLGCTNINSANEVDAKLTALSLPKRIILLRCLGMLLAGVLLIPALALLRTAWQKFQAPTPPEPWILSITGLGALILNLSCAFLVGKVPAS